MYNLYTVLTQCQDDMPNVEFEKVISSLDAILLQYQEPEPDMTKIQKTMNTFSELYSKITTNDFKKIFEIPKAAIQKHSISNQLLNSKDDD